MDCLLLKSLFSQWSALMTSNIDYLTRLDGIAGDSDIGIVMSDGFSIVNNVISTSEETDIGGLLHLAGKTLSRAAPSSMGTLISMGLLTAGKRLKGVFDLDNEGIIELLASIAVGVTNTGKAQEGEKTFLDSILPAVRSCIQNKNLPTNEMTSGAAKAAEEGFHNATMMVAKHGRIAFRGEHSVGIEDPGAAVAMLLVKGLSNVYNESITRESINETTR